MLIVIPCAGNSKRYPGTRPKYLLTMPDGRLMVEWAAHNYLNKYPIRIIITRQHEAQHDARNILSSAFKNNPMVEIVTIEGNTNGPAETIYVGTMDLLDGTIIVQDCDSFFEYTIPENKNFACYINLEDYPKLDEIASKSFMTMHAPTETISSIIEKQVISNQVCVGAYGISQLSTFRTAYQYLSIGTEEIYISHCIKTLLNLDVPFNAVHATNYRDMGSISNYDALRNAYATYFIDIDGTIIKNQTEHSSVSNYDTEPSPLKPAIDYFLAKQKCGATLIFITARPKQYADKTKQMLVDFGFDDPVILFNMPHSPRIIVNDISASAAYPAASSINCVRDSLDFWNAIR